MQITISQHVSDTTATTKGFAPVASGFASDDLTGQRLRLGANPSAGADVRAKGQKIGLGRRKTPTWNAEFQNAEGRSEKYVKGRGKRLANGGVFQQPARRSPNIGERAVFSSVAHENHK